MCPAGLFSYMYDHFSDNKPLMLLKLIASVDVLCSKADVVGCIRPATPRAINAPLMLTIPL